MDYKSIKMSSQQGQKILASYSYRENLKNVAYGMAGDRVKLSFFLSGSELGYSDGKTIFVNLFPQIFSEETLDVILTYHIALIVHEYSHVLYTNFTAVVESSKKPLLKHLFNIIEDSRIERISSFKLPGYAMAIYCLRKALYKEEKVSDELEFFMQSILYYSTLGMQPNNVSQQCQDDWNMIRKLVKAARLKDDCLECYEICKRIYYILEKYNAQSQYQMPIQVIRVFEGACDGQDGDTQGQDDRSNGQTSNGGTDNSSNNTADNSKSSSMKSLSGEAKSGSSSKGKCNCNAESDAADTSQKQNSSSGNSSGEGSSIQEDGTLKERLEEFLSELAENLENTIEEYEREEANEKFDQQLALDMIQSGIRSLFYVDDKQIELYNRIKSESSGIISNMKRKLYNVIRFNDDEVTRRQTRGKIDSKSLTNIINGRVCRTFKEKSDETDLNVTLLLDSSGSMEGQRAKETLRASIVLQEALEMLKIPVSTLSFDNVTSILNLWNRKSKLKKYAVVNYIANGGTYLYQALDAAEKLFQKQQRYDKMILIITDGEPTMKTETAQRITQLRNKYDAQIYGIGIGKDIAMNDSNFIALFGAEYFICVDKLDSLPLEMSKIVKRNLLRK